MKLYIANGVYVGTQADARAINKTFAQVEVPTDKDGLIKYLNENIAFNEPQEDEFETVVERHDPPIETGPSHTETSIAIDDVWDELPLARKAHFAALFCEDARDAADQLSAAASVKAQAKPAVDDELFS